MTPQRVATTAVVAVLTAFSVVIQDFTESYYEPLGVRKVPKDAFVGAKWLASCMKNDTQLFEETRLKREVWDGLLKTLTLRGWLKDSQYVDAGEKLLSFLYLCSNGASYRNLSWRCGHSKETISRHFHEVRRALLNLYPEVVKPADVTKIPTNIRDQPKRWPYFDDCIGAIDGTHLFANVPEDKQARYRNHYGDLTQNVLAVVDFDMNFTYVLAGWEGTAHDMRVYNDALRDKGLPTALGKYYVADAGYSNNDNLLTPYKKVRYHLREIKLSKLVPKDKYELFNYRHSSLRNIVERCFGIFKRRWRIFDRSHQFSLETQRDLVYCLCTVHNYINTFYNGEDDMVELSPYPAEMQDRAAAEAANLAALRVPEVLFDTRKMDERRDEIAEAMWEDYLIYKA